MSDFNYTNGHSLQCTNWIKQHNLFDTALIKMNVQILKIYSSSSDLRKVNNLNLWNLNLKHKKMFTIKLDERHNCDHSKLPSRKMFEITNGIKFGFQSEREYSWAYSSNQLQFFTTIGRKYQRMMDYLFFFSF